MYTHLILSQVGIQQRKTFKGPHNICYLQTRNFTSVMLPRYNAADSVETHNCTYGHQRKFSIRSSLGNLIHLQSPMGFTSKSCRGSKIQLAFGVDRKHPEMVIVPKGIHSLSSNGTIVSPHSDIVLYNGRNWHT